MTDRALFRERNTELYSTFRFAVTLPGRGDEMLRAMSVYCDPFTWELWIGRAHFTGEKTLAQLLCEETCLDVWMLPRGDKPTRQIHVTFAGLRALPLNLDASADEVALEWVVLQKVKCSPPRDVMTPERFRQPAITKTKAGAAAHESGACDPPRCNLSIGHTGVHQWQVPREPAHTVALAVASELAGERMEDLQVTLHVPASVAASIRRGEMSGISMSSVAPVPKACQHEFVDGHCHRCGYPGA